MITNDLILAQWSIEEYHQMIAAGILSDRRVELLEGEIIEMSPEGPLHTFYGEGLANYLRRQLWGRAWVREARPVTLADSEPEPDIAVVKLPWSQYSEHHPYPEDIFWLVEISDSTLAKDMTEKQKIYSRVRILEYWVLDVREQKVIVFRKSNPNGYSVRLEYSQGKITSLAFPDVEIPLLPLFSGQILSE